MLKRMTFVTVALAIVSLGLLAACNSKTPEEKAQSFVNHSARKFDLTDYQKARLLEVASVALDLRAELTKDQDELNVELINMFVSDQLDQPRINQVLTEKEEIFKTYSRLLITRVAEFHDSLSPQQRREIAEILRKHSRR